MNNELSVQVLRVDGGGPGQPVQVPANGTRLPEPGKVLPGRATQGPRQDGAPDLQQADVETAVRNLNEYAQRMNRELHFNVDKDSGRTVIRVIDPDSGEVIRQIPPEEILALARYLQKGDEDRGRLVRDLA